MNDPVWWCPLAALVAAGTVAYVRFEKGALGLPDGMWSFLAALAFLAPFFLCLFLL